MDGFGTRKKWRPTKPRRSVQKIPEERMPDFAKRRRLAFDKENLL
jgi:hypothetical protein